MLALRSGAGLVRFAEIVDAHVCAAIFKQTSGGKHHADEMAGRAAWLAARGSDSSRTRSDCATRTNGPDAFTSSGDCISRPAGFHQGSAYFVGCGENSLRAGK